MADQVPQLAILHTELSQEFGAEAAERIAARVQARYQELMAGRPAESHEALREHLEGQILPGLALYDVLRQAQDDGLSPSKDDTLRQLPQDEALAWVERWFVARMVPRRRQMARLGRFRLYYHVLRALVRPVMARSFPPQGWDVEWVEVSGEQVAFNMHSCYYLDTLTAYGVPELTAVYCALDDRIYDGLSPHVRWVRSHTLGRGDELCDFRFVRLRKGPGWRARVEA